MNQQENAGASRNSRSAESTEFAANLGTGWNNYTAGRASDESAAPRTVSADPPVGGTGRNHPRFKSAPWRQGATASGYDQNLPADRRVWTDAMMRNTLISTFLASRPGQSPVDMSSWTKPRGQVTYSTLQAIQGPAPWLLGTWL